MVYCLLNSKTSSFTHLGHYAVAAFEIFLFLKNIFLNLDIGIFDSNDNEGVNNLFFFVFLYIATYGHSKGHIEALPRFCNLSQDARIRLRFSQNYM